MHPIKTILLIALLSTMSIASGMAQSLYDLPLKDIDGNATTLAAYKGKVLLIVNVASKCGYTKQYRALEAMYRKHADQGLVVLGFPCNQFGGQEPGSNQEIREFCTGTYDVTFPLFDKIEVNGPGQSPLYAQLTGENSPFPGAIKWNFTKFLIGRDGTILRRFESKTTPDSPEMEQAIQSALSKP